MGNQRGSAMMNVNEKDIKQFEADKEQIRKAFLQIYDSLFAINLCQGGTQGHARQKALEQISAFIENKKNHTNPLNEYLIQLNSEHRKSMSEYIMKSSFSNDVFNDDVAAKQWGKMAETELKSSLGKFNDIYRKYPAVQQDNVKNVQSNEQQQRLIQMYLQMAQQKTRESRGR